MALRQPQPRATRTGASHKPSRGNSAARSSAYAKTSNRKAGKGRSTSSKQSKQKRGRKSSATRANVFRDAQAKSNAALGLDVSDEIEVAKAGFSVSKSNSKLSYEESMDLIGKRRNNTDDITEKELEELEAIQEEEEEAKTREKDTKAFRESVAQTKVPIYGNLRVQEKPDNAIRFFGHNINSMSFWLNYNYKAERLKYIFEQYGIDTMGLQEVCINWSKFKSSQTLASLLRHGPERIRSVASYNKTELENQGRHQRGGTSTIIRDQLAGFVVDSGVDATGLGRYSWYKLEGEPGHCTYVITAYAPCGNSAMGDGTVYKQQERFIQLNGLRTNPKTMFRDDLLATLRRWRAAGHRVVLMMDANEPVLDGCLCKALQGEDLMMQEAVHSVMPGPGPNTHFRGKDAIDGIWYSSDLELISASYLPFDANMGDHRPVAADFTMESILGKHLKKIVPPPARRLNSKVKKIRQEYINRLENSFRKHGIYEKLLVLESRATYPVTEEVAKALEALDVLVTELMLHAEKKCRKLRAGHYEFSPVIKGWLDKCHAYKQLIRLKLRGHSSKINVGNLKRFARRCKIENPLDLTRQELGDLYRECREHCKRLLAESPWLRKQYLSDKLSDAIAKANDEDAKRIQDIIKQEARAKSWAGIKMCTKPNGVSACTEIDVPQPDGSVAKMLKKEEIEDGIHEEIMKRFARADGAPICHGPLYDLLGYCADTEAAEQILEGTFVPPPGTDGPTLVILEEISRIWKKLGDGEVELTVTQEDYQHYWRRVKERIASSYSGLHFGHYKSTAYSDFLSKVLAKKISIISQTGSAPDRWARGLSVMLEKIAGVALVTKLRAILLMEADFNFHNKLIFGKRMLDLARAHDLVPEEIYSAKGKTSEDAILHQVLMYDIARQLRRPLLVASVDASQCYDRVAHAMAALILRAYKVRQSSVMGMLQPIQCMEYYLRTGFGESTSFSGGKHDKKQGLCQGNGAAPPTWQQISTIMIRAQHRLGHGVLIESPISKRSIKQVGVCYVDDNNMWAGLAPDDDDISTTHKGQQSCR